MGAFVIQHHRPFFEPPLFPFPLRYPAKASHSAFCILHSAFCIFMVPFLFQNQPHSRNYDSPGAIRIGPALQEAAVFSGKNAEMRYITNGGL